MHEFFPLSGDAKTLMEQFVNAVRCGRRIQCVQLGNESADVELMTLTFHPSSAKIQARRVSDGATIVFDVPLPLNRCSVASAELTTF